MGAETRTPKFVRWAFEQMAGLAGGIAAMNKPDESLAKYENGRHGDLKPENILLFEDKLNESWGTLRIADAGLARFHEQVTSKRVAGTTTYGSTIEYAPPEARSTKDGIPKRSRRFDIWSLGCVYLEFTIWILGGFAEVETFRDSKKSPKSRRKQFYEESTSKGYKTHPKVKDYLSKLRSHERCGENTCFRDLLEIIRKHLLVVNVEKRMESSELCSRFGKILQQGTERPEYWCGPGFEPQPFPPKSGPRNFLERIASLSAS